ncbi:hypothetical protein FOQG_18905 [Fusarium oxysporum f. sp. raphani 54005]|uniref:PD-(D/E)XK nuclease-like domain-containing protein n=3 Tax=Fusarium oxysporum TaxID=5507 RepID=X0BC02_FUSOX|nr:hypothetical protein FOQG_18905 [Fusarium oxysporum f. sp. raphani 54005]EXM12667.1 hypothetical protein FOTG_18847 [Fusarium oxysporum f. sp. vasinfectum 25433]KAG7414868.1 hypothetical protein Forpi1262_v016885 [Fusarium oxysporum f. sp. raphani]KAK2666723.1 hypothetical protein RAB80_017840 [Fusarium oxysporum f. sp. vasinfectum]KAK2922955.1 hypothetical protein FoTM2_017197 [Fusarium oxysporum f. sp. vasinfectum]
MHDGQILEWLKNLPLKAQSHAKTSIVSRKRRRAPPTPDSSDSAMPSSRGGSPNKRMRRMVEYGDTSEQETPRATKIRAQTPSSSRGSIPHLSSESASQDSRASGRTSPRKHLLVLEGRNDGIRIQDLAGLQHPDLKLQAFLKMMRNISRGRGILPRSMQPATLLGVDPAFLEIAEDDACFSDEREKAGPCPALESVLEALEAAIECSENLHAESTWNIEVHQKLLGLAFRPSGQSKFSHSVNFTSCSTATILSEYLPAFSPSKKVDFCIYVDPSAVLEGRKSINLRAHSVNPTDYYPLRNRLLAVCIETKKPGEGWEGATLQLSVWKAAQWKIIEELEKFKQHKLASESPVDANAGRQLEQDMPQFVPGIIIQGHDWNIVVATREGAQTVLWNKLTIGSTSSVMGIYQIIYALHVLRDWCQQTYWSYIYQAITI